jgi:hypothetical protein
MPAPAPKASDEAPVAKARTGLRATLAGWVGRPAYERSPRPWNRQKSGRVAMFASFAVPGLGQLYNEREFWAAVAAGVEFYFIGNIVVEQRQTNLYRDLMHQDPNDKDAQVLYELHRDNRIQSTWLLGLTMLISGLQSYVDANLFDFDRSPPPRLQLSLKNGPSAGLRWRF